MPGPRDYTSTTRTALAAFSKGMCYFPGFTRPVIVLVDGEPYVDVHIAHIRDAEVGSRYDPSMSNDERRAFSNLILLCKPHHDLVDKRHPTEFVPDHLLSWKVAREGNNLVIDDPTALAEDVLEEALLAGASANMTMIRIEQGGLHLGGKGGNATGAGGGGGGVVGSGSGGPGGDGSTVQLADDVRIDLDGAAGASFGAGGGGGGLLDSGVLVRRAHDGEGREGRGHSEGLDGQDGQPTSFGDPTTDFFIEVPGGSGGFAGDGTRRASDVLGLSLLTLANSTELRAGLLFVLGGAWQSIQTLNLGDTLRLVVVMVFEAGSLETGDYTTTVSVTDPAGSISATVKFPVTVEESGDLVRIPRLVVVDVAVSAFGIWTVSVDSATRRMGSIHLMVKRAGVNSALPAS